MMADVGLFNIGTGRTIQRRINVLSDGDFKFHQCKRRVLVMFGTGFPTVDSRDGYFSHILVPFSY
jgi:hypothetical protein